MAHTYIARPGEDYASDAQLSRIERTLTANNLYHNDWDRLWHILEAARVDERERGDGTPIYKGHATQIITWLARQGYEPPAPAARADGADVADGYYAVASRTGHNDLDFWRVSHRTPAEGKWAGRTFTNVSRVIGGHPDQRVGRDEAQAAVAAIVAAGEDAARTLYGQTIGACGHCNRHLTDDLSRARGIGPDCWVTHGHAA